MLQKQSLNFIFLLKELPPPAFNTYLETLQHSARTFIVYDFVDTAHQYSLREKCPHLGTYAVADLKKLLDFIVKRHKVI